MQMFDKKTKHNIGGEEGAPGQKTLLLFYYFLIMRLSNIKNTLCMGDMK